MAITRVLTQDCIARIVRHVGLDRLLDELIERLAETFATHDPELIQSVVRDGFRYEKPDLGLVEWMPAMEIGRRVAIKTVGYHPTNPVERLSPSVLATTSLYDTLDGRLVALCEATFLTALRTGAASAVVTDVLASRDASTMGVVGCGAQAVTQVHAISRVRPIERVLAFDADTSIADTLPGRLEAAGVTATIEVVATPADVVSSADVLCTVTSVEPGDGPVIPDVDHRPWLHINAVGADHPGKFEVATSLLERATVIPDLLAQCLLEGESQRLDLASLGPDMALLLRDRSTYEHLRSALTVFDSTGWALEDLVAAELMLDHGERLGIGFALDLQPDPVDPYDPYEFLRQ